MNINEIAKLIENEGGRLYLVGGAIRDELLGKKGFDEDYCVTGLNKEEFEKLFPDAINRGKVFEVYDLEHREFALARKDTKEGTGHKGFKIITGKEITIEEDLKRRDITINSIAKDVLTKEIIDPFNGREDIKRRTIKANGQSFSEDPLRVYRVARIASSLEFDVEKGTLKLMESLRGELDTLSKERVFVELKKALENKRPSIFFNILKKANVLDIHFKEIYDLVGSEQPLKYHPEGDSYNHTMIALDNSCILTNNVEIRFATLVHDLGKGITPKHIQPHHHGHDKAGIDLVEKLGNRIGVPKRWLQSGVVSCREHMKGGIFYKMSVNKQVEFIERVNQSILGLEGLQIVVYADRCRLCDLDNMVDKEYDFENLARKMLKEVDGTYLRKSFIKKNNEDFIVVDGSCEEPCVIKQKYEIPEGEKFREKLHEERVRWMKENKYSN